MLQHNLEIDLQRHLSDEVTVRLGVFVLASDQGIEKDLRSILPDSVAIHVVRMPDYMDCSKKGSSHEAELKQAASLFSSCEKIDYFIYGCTSSEVIHGTDYIQSTIRQVLQNARLITPLNSLNDALASIGHNQITILSPYDTSLNEILSTALKNRGLIIENIYQFPLDQNYQCACITREFFKEAARIIKNSQPTCLFVPCNSLSVLNHVDTIENILGRKVLTSTQTIVWKIAKLLRLEHSFSKRSGALLNNYKG